MQVCCRKLARATRGFVARQFSAGQSCVAGVQPGLTIVGGAMVLRFKHYLPGLGLVSPLVSAASCCGFSRLTESIRPSPASI
jgi:hypothetical protein